MKVFIKFHVKNEIETVAACDEELLNQVFKEGNLRIEISNQFFGGTLRDNLASLGLARQLGFKEVEDIHFLKLFGFKKWKYDEVQK